MNKKIIIFIPLFLLFAFVAKFSLDRTGAFGCFDDCLNYMGAYFMLKDKTLYSEIFFNHQMLGAYISYLIQFIAKPQTIYQLVLYHRIFVLLVSFLLSVLLVMRFRWPALFFVIFYELTKFYIFGERFLAEALVVYPLVYLFGVALEKLEKKNLSPIDYFFASIFAWFVIFMREPFVPLALVLYLTVLIGKKFEHSKRYCLALFFILSILTLVTVPIKDYLFNVFTVNTLTVGKSEAGVNSLFGIGFLKIFFYPIYIFISGPINFFRFFLIGVSVIFLILLGTLLKIKRGKKALIIFFVLGLANIRFVEPGTKFYESFHMIPWYGVYLFAIFLVLWDLPKKWRKKILGTLFVILAVFLLSKESYIWEKVDRQSEFVTNYAQYIANGEVVKRLSDTNDTLFVDRSDDLVFWQSGLASLYKYSWYTSVMPRIQKYENARIEMFQKNPPDFYYGYCSKDSIGSLILPEFVKNEYALFYFAGKPTCLYVSKAKIPEISDKQWESIKQFEYYLPEKL